MADAAFNSLLIHSATIRRAPAATGALKNPTVAYGDVATGVRCRIKPVKADSKQAIGGAVMDSDHKGYFPPDAELRERDQVVCGGITYDVRGVERPVDGAGVHHLTAHLKRKQVA